MVMRNELTEEQITNLMRSIPRAEEVYRLRAEIERLFNEDTKTRHALKGWALVCPDGGDEPTHERVAAVVAEVERLRVKNERLRERLLQERAALVLDEIGAALERERVLRAALTDMMSGWRYIRDTYGDLAGVGWDRVEQKAREALEGKP